MKIELTLLGCVVMGWLTACGPTEPGKYPGDPAQARDGGKTDSGDVALTELGALACRQALVTQTAQTAAKRCFWGQIRFGVFEEIRDCTQIFGEDTKRGYCKRRTTLPAPLLQVQVDGKPRTTNANGIFTWLGADQAPLTLSPQGEQVEIRDDQGHALSKSVVATSGGVIVWDEGSDPLADAHLNAYLYAQRARDWVERFVPGFGSKMPKNQIVVNDRGENCGASVDRFTAGADYCGNAALEPDVVYHETGHAIQDALSEGSSDGALSEGFADAVAVTLTEDPAFERSYWEITQGAPIRNVSTPDFIWEVTPCEDEHEKGLAFSGAFWDLREALIAKLGREQGVEHAERLLIRAVSREGDTTRMLQAFLAADDTDADLTNGTPNAAEIREAFRLHGLE